MEDDKTKIYIIRKMISLNIKNYKYYKLLKQKNLKIFILT